jgi:hypothetical protein
MELIIFILISLPQYIRMASIVSQKPAELVISDLRSADDHITNRRQVEIIPRQQNTFGQQNDSSLYTGNISQKLTFYISDSRGMLDGPNSYITGEFEARVLTNNDVPIEAYLDEGGVHSCISQITLKSGSATIERIEDYAKIYNIMRFATVGEEHVDSVEWQALDSSADAGELVPKNNFGCVSELGALTGTVTLGAAGAMAGALTVFTTELNVGDRVQVVDATGGYTSIVTILTITSNTAATYSPQAAPVGAAGSAPYLIQGVTTKYEKRPMRYLAVNSRSASGLTSGTVKMRFTMKLMLKFLSHKKYIPLALFPAPLELDIEFNPARLCLTECTVGGAATAGAKFGYRILNPRFMASIIEVDDTNMAEHVSAYEQGGLQYPFMSFRRYVNRLQTSETNAQFTFQTNLISARAVYTVLCNEASQETDVVAAQPAKSQSNFEKSGVTRYRYNSGALRFPDSRDVLTDDFSGSEAFAQLNIAVNHHSNTLHDTMIDVHAWSEGNYFDDTAGDFAGASKTNVATKFIFAAALAKHGSSFMTGIDLSTQFLQLDLSKAPNDLQGNAHTAKQVKTFILYDSALLLSRSNGLLVKA